MKEPNSTATTPTTPSHTHTLTNSTNQDRDNIPANLAKRFELLEQRFHSPSIAITGADHTTTTGLSNQMSSAAEAAAVYSNSQLSRHSHSHSHSIGFQNQDAAGVGVGGESSSVVSGSNNAATRLMSNAKGKQSQTNTTRHISHSNQGSMSSVSNPLPVSATATRAFLQVNRAAEMHIQKACKLPLLSFNDGASDKDRDVTIKDQNPVVGSQNDKNKKRSISPNRHATQIKKESSRKQSKPIKKSETVYSNSSAFSRKKSRSGGSLQTTLDLSNPPPSLTAINENSSNHTTSQHRQPATNEGNASRDKSMSNHSTIRSSTTISKKISSKQRRIDTFMSNVKRQSTHDSTTNAAKQIGPLSPISCGRKSPNVYISLAPNQNVSIDLEIEQLRNRCQSLEQLCNDKEERLKAVANNQTIIHSSLKSALQTKEKEIERMNEAHKRKTEFSMQAIENLVRVDAIREAKDVREKLASDGGRLGRLVYSRAGLHTIESWENGYSTISLKSRRAALLTKKEILEKRQKDLKKMSKHGQTRLVDSPSEVNSIPASNVGYENAVDIDIISAEESLRMHLNNIKKDEQKLILEKEALDKEKAAHIRQLRRVANEDASRFKGNPKLHARYVLYNLLGKGGFSEVWKGYDIVELRQVAVKIHQLDPRWSEAKKDNYTKHVSREYEIHRNVRHPRIVSLYDVFEIDSDSFATVLECCDGTDLDTILKEQSLLPERSARAMLLQILSGMRYLSSSSADGTRQGIIHYDLKPGNILFDEFGDAKITDFGLSKIVDTESSENSMELTSQGAGTYWYLPPECFITHESVRISNKVDVWSIGVIYYQMLFGRRPFGHGETQDKVLSNQTMLNARDVQFPPKPQISQMGKDFIQSCLTYDQTLRPSISELCQDPYLSVKKI